MRFSSPRLRVPNADIGGGRLCPPIAVSGSTSVLTVMSYCILNRVIAASFAPTGMSHVHRFNLSRIAALCRRKEMP